MGRSIGITDQGRILLKGRLKEIGISQTELAGKCFLSEKTIERLFKKHNIDRANLEDVCVFLGVPVSEVVYPEEWNRLQNPVNPHNPTEELNQIEQHIPRRTFKNIVDDKTREFVGRKYIYGQIDEYLNDKNFPSGYIILKGEPGIGKTALMANLVRQKEWIHHFVTEVTDSTESFLASICSQLIVKYELPYSKLPECQPEQRILTYRKFIDEDLLPQAIEKVKDNKEDNTVVILVDALDEAKRSPLDGELNILGLPKALPQGVFFIVTSREAEDQHFYVNNNRRIDIKDDDDDNLNDVRRYVWNYLNDPGVKKQIEKWQVSDGGFVEKITEKSEGNFMYLFYVMTDIKEQKLSEDIEDSIHHLPQGLNGYYNKHWDFMEKSYKDRFREIDEKVIRIIAAFQEPASIQDIVRIGKFQIFTVVEIMNLWRNFFNIDDEHRYRLYHRSFYDFLKIKFHFDDITSFDEDTHDLFAEDIFSDVNLGDEL
jgi:DNA-binding Xre family transcriptional regulator/DNA polymerase III delta prime subunit